MPDSNAGPEAAGFDGDVDFLVDARELLGHAVPGHEHRVLANFEDSSHKGADSGSKNGEFRFTRPSCSGLGTVTSRTGMLMLQTSMWPAGRMNQPSRRLRRASTYFVNRWRVGAQDFECGALGFRHIARRGGST